MLNLHAIWKQLSRKAKPRIRDNRVHLVVEELEPRDVPAGPPYQTVILTQMPAQIYPGEIVTLAIKVAIEDSAGNIVTTATGVIQLADSAGQVGGNIVATAVDGVATFANVYFANAAPTDRLGAADITQLLLGGGTLSNPFAVLPVPTETTVSATPNPSTFNQPVTITATVTSLVSGLLYSPVGYVEFTSGNTVIANIRINGNDEAVWTTSSLPIGSDSITANYLDQFSLVNWLPSSATMTQVVNPAPPILYNPGNQSSDQDNFVYLQLAGSDPNGGTLTYSETGLPASLSLDSQTGLISGTITGPPADYSVTVTATDSYGLSASQSFTWTVVGNAPPTLANPGNQENAEGDTISPLQLQGSDTDGGTLSYSVLGLPAGLSDDSSTGLITGTVSASPGQYGVTATVTDLLTGLSASQTFTWTVTAKPPVAVNHSYTDTEDKMLTVNAADGVLVGDSDPQGSPLTAQIYAAPAHGQLTLNPDGSFSYKPDKGFVGTDTFTYVAMDQFGAESKPAEVNLLVAQKQPETVPQIGTIKVKAGFVSYSIKATDGPLGKGVTAIFKFTPAKGLNDSDIVFLQVVKSTLGGKEDFPRTSKIQGDQTPYWKLYSTKTGWILDHQIGDQVPYVGLAWDGKNYISRNKNAFEIGSGPAGTDAEMADRPREGLARTGRGADVEKFETAIYSISTGQVLGVISWGYTVPDNKNQAIILDKTEVNESVSTNFRAAMEKADQVQGMTVKIGEKEFTANAMLHAQANGAPKITSPSVLPRKK